MANRSHEINRRQVLQGIGSAGIGTIAVGSASGSESNGNIEVIEPTGSRRNRLIAEARTERQFRTLTNRLRNDGYEPVPQNAIVTITKSDGEIHHRTVVTPFQSERRVDDEKLAYWTDLPDDIESDIPAVASVTISSNSRSVENEISVERANGSIASRTSIDSGQIRNTQSGSSIQPLSSGCNDQCPCCQDGYVCESYNWSCFVGTILTAAGVVGGCALCLASLGFNATCYVCISSALGAGLVGGCDLGNNCTMEPLCAPPTVC